MKQHVRDRLAAAIGMTGVALGIGAVVNGGVSSGIQLGVDGDRVVVSRVTPYSLAAMDGVESGMIVLRLNGTDLYRLPQNVYPEEDPNAIPTDEYVEPSPIAVEPPVPTAVTIDEVTRSHLAREPVRNMDAISEGSLADGGPDYWDVRSYWYEPPFGAAALWPLGVGVSLLAGGWFALRGGAGGPGVPALAAPLAVAVATPFLVQPLATTWEVWAVVVAGIVTVAAMIPLADALLERIEGPAEQRQMLFAAAFCIVAAVVVIVAMVQSRPDWTSDVIRWGLIGAIPLLPGLAAAGPINLEGWRTTSASSGRLLQSTEFAVAGATPMFAIGSAHAPAYVPLLLWLVAIAVAGRFTVRPLVRIAPRAQLQRDLIVAATEAERARLAADIHDEALQELTLLVRRLETAGDTEGAELGRTVAHRLRAICGDLRLPILDDLGVGPALDWLVLRIERLAGGEVRLEREDGTRPPPDVELAVFRVAQEALANAVKHGQPPIVVRYRATDSGVSLSIDDAGPGIAPDAGAVAEKGGHFGLLNMQQRAEQIGAILDVRRWPGGGTHVALEWRQG